MGKSLLKPLLIGAGLRLLLFTSNYSGVIKNRIEIATPLNSWKRAKEGVYLYKNEMNPYEGDIFHQSPLFLFFNNFLIQNIEQYIWLFFILVDLLTSVVLREAAVSFVAKQMQTQNSIKKAENVDDLILNEKDVSTIPYYVAVAYLMNPYSILNCVGQTTTVWSNFLLALYFYGLAKQQILLTVTVLALETQQNFYPFVLIVPAALLFCKDRKNTKLVFVQTILLFIGVFAGVNYLGYIYFNDFNFINSTYGFILSHRDFQPNIGLFWYFFMEMFDHFRTLFLYTFQMNATILYLLPLTFKLKEEPVMLATILTALNAIFRSYPCIGDVAFYLALLPLWKKSYKFMTHNFIVGCFFLVTSILGPTVYYLWIYLKSANANFFFGVTLAFSTAQIFLVTDLLFAFIKKEFCLRNGTEFKINGKDAKLALQ